VGFCLREVIARIPLQASCARISAFAKSPTLIQFEQFDRLASIPETLAVSGSHGLPHLAQECQCVEPSPDTTTSDLQQGE